MCLSDYFLFSNLKKFLRGRRFPDVYTVKEAVTGYFDIQGASFFSEGIRSLETKLSKWLQSRGTTLKNEVSFIITFNFHAQVDYLLSAPRIYVISCEEGVI